MPSALRAHPAVSEYLSMGTRRSVSRKGSRDTNERDSGLLELLLRSAQLRLPAGHARCYSECGSDPHGPQDNRHHTRNIRISHPTVSSPQQRLWFQAGGRPNGGLRVAAEPEDDQERCKYKQATQMIDMRKWRNWQTHQT
jgi:hypothetical protein